MEAPAGVQYLRQLYCAHPGTKLALMSAVAQCMPSIEIFFSYSHEDETLRKALDAHLSELWRSGIGRWHDRQIGPGTEWEGQIDDHLNSAQIILLLVSKSFLNSNYCYDIELKRALERHERREASVIPILMRPIARWKKSPFWKLQCLPINGKPVTEWNNQDAALAAVAEEIIRIVEKLRGDEQPAEVWPRLAPQAPWPLIRWWATAAVTMVVAAGLIVLGIRERLPWQTRPASTASTLAIGEQERINLAFAVGSSIAMAGQSTQNAGNAVFHRALGDLRFDPGTIQELDGRYAELARSVRGDIRTYDELENAKSALMRRVNALLPSSDAAAAELAHDLVSFQLLLRYWPRYEEKEALRVASDRVQRLQRSARKVALPRDTTERIRTLDAVNLIQSEYRDKTRQLLDDAMLHFDRASGNGS